MNEEKNNTRVMNRRQPKETIWETPRENDSQGFSMHY